MCVFTKPMTLLSVYCQMLALRQSRRGLKSSDCDERVKNPKKLEALLHREMRAAIACRERYKYFDSICDSLYISKVKANRGSPYISMAW